MAETHRYIKYLIQEDCIITDENKIIEVYNLDIKEDRDIFKEWARQFRRNYCSDERLEFMSSRMKKSPSCFLKEYKLPNKPSTMSGDFGEILVSDYLQYLKHYIVPRTRYNNRINKDNPTQGSDVLGYRYNDLQPNKSEVIVIEVKSSVSSNNDYTAKNKLQKAIEDSNKDFARFSTSIVASYERLIEMNNVEEADIVSKFLNIADQPYQIIFGAAAIHSNDSFAPSTLKKVVSVNHRDFAQLKLIVIHSDRLMDFINKLYSKASEV